MSGQHGEDRVQRPPEVRRPWRPRSLPASWSRTGRPGNRAGVVDQHVERAERVARPARPARRRSRWTRHVADGRPARDAPWPRRSTRGALELAASRPQMATRAPAWRELAGQQQAEAARAAGDEHGAVRENSHALRAAGAARARGPRGSPVPASATERQRALIEPCSGSRTTLVHSSCLVVPERAVGLRPRRLSGQRWLITKEGSISPSSICSSRGSQIAVHVRLAHLEGQPLGEGGAERHLVEEAAVDARDRHGPALAARLDRLAQRVRPVGAEAHAPSCPVVAARRSSCRAPPGPRRRCRRRGRGRPVSSLQLLDHVLSARSRSSRALARSRPAAAAPGTRSMAITRSAPSRYALTIAN